MSGAGRALFVRLVRHEDKESGLQAAAELMQSGAAGLSQSDAPDCCVVADDSVRRIFTVEPETFRLLPNSPFAYWVSDSLRRTFLEFPSLGEVADVQHGASTKDDFRFVRAVWEVEPGRIAGPPFPSGWSFPGYKAFRGAMENQLSSGKRWAFFAKGGEYSPYYADIHLVVDWEDSGRRIHEYVVSRYPYLNGNSDWILHPENFYFRPGLTFPRRPSHRLEFRVFPAAVIFGVNAPAIFADLSIAPGLLVWGNTQLIDRLCSLMLPRGGEGSSQTRTIEVGTIANMPWQGDVAIRSLVTLGTQLVIEAQFACGDNETSPLACCCSRRFAGSLKMADRDVDTDDAERFLIKAYAISESDVSALEISIPAAHPKHTSNENAHGDLWPGLRGIVSQAFGCALGRWDVRIAKDPSLAPNLQDVFDPLPTFPPGGLVAPDGYGATSNNIVSDEWLRARPDAIRLPPEGAVKRAAIADEEYPIQVAWDGILVDDEGHPNDIVTRVDAVLAYVWEERAEAIAQEACDMLEMTDLRTFFRRRFFNDHIKRYSKSRRKAPIYWLLQSARKNYGIWIYCHRMTRDTLARAADLYARQKLDRESARLSELQNQLQPLGDERGRERRRLERKIERQEDLVAEIREFHQKLTAVAQQGWDLDLNDGIVLAMAPLHELTPWKEPAKYWKELLAGRYEWSSMSQQLRSKGLV